jgi:hypothetical protein
LSSPPKNAAAVSYCIRLFMLKADSE